MVRVAINGYGRIGRVAHRILLENFGKDAQVAAINAGSSTDLQGWLYLLQYDTVYGPLKGHSLSLEPSQDPSLLGTFVIDNQKIPVLSQQDPAQLPWKNLSIDIVIDSTGAFRSADKLQAHINAGAKKVILSAPAKDDMAVFVKSVNDKNYQGQTIISNASCTTNCITPVAKIMQDHFGIVKAMMTTVHGYTSDQRLQDGGHKDYRRARAAAENIIPTTTGATSAAAKALPSLANKFTGLSLRVPVPVGSLSDITAVLAKPTTPQELNQIFTQEAQGAYKGIVAVTNDPIVSSDIIGNPASAIIDLSLTQVVGGDMVKVVCWYDNEYGYAHRLVEQALSIALP